MGPLSHLAREGSNDDIGECLSRFDSYARAEALAVLMMFASPRRSLQIFLEWGNVCDAPWPYRAMIADKLRPSVAEVNLVELLEPVARDFYASLPDPVPVWRGCEQARERGLYWTTERAVAEGFARGRRCVNKHPTLVSGKFPSGTSSVFLCTGRNMKWFLIIDDCGSSGSRRLSPSRTNHAATATTLRTEVACHCPPRGD
jgi:hypothetical protein